MRQPACSLFHDEHYSPDQRCCSRRAVGMGSLHVPLPGHATCVFLGKSSSGGGRSAFQVPRRPGCRLSTPAASLQRHSSGLHIGAPVHIPFADITVPTPESAVSNQPTSRVGIAHRGSHPWLISGHTAAVIAHLECMPSRQLLIASLQAETAAENWVAPWEGGVWSPLFFVFVGVFLLTNWLIQREEAVPGSREQ